MNTNFDFAELLRAHDARVRRINRISFWMNIGIAAAILVPVTATFIIVWLRS